MNKRKIIFIIILICILIGVFVLIFVSKKNQQNALVSQNAKKKWDLKVWIVWDDKDKFSDFIWEFKKTYKDYSSSKIDVESFPNYEEYMNSLALSFVTWNVPDVFVLNNNEKSIFTTKIGLIPNTIINTNDFRKRFKWIFPDELIINTWTWEKVTEFVSWVPIWYETLGVFYRRWFLKSKDFLKWASLSSAVSDIKTQYPEFIPIWIWNWSSVYWVSDIITSFFVWNNIFGIDNLWNGNSLDTVKSALLSYLMYWDTTFYNSYNSKFSELKSTWENNLDLFSSWTVLSVIWYPRMIEKIDEKWYQPNFLLADAFPMFGLAKDEKTLINYNYFVVNKDTKNSKLAYSLLQYMLSEKWARDYLKKFTYYLPSMLSLESEKLNENIYPWYNIKLGDFYKKDRIYTSFDKWNKAIYDREIVPILDDEKKYWDLFEAFRTSLLCRVKKLTDFENLWEDCYKK